MRKEIEKLCLTEKQYDRIGTAMMLLGEGIFLANVFLTDYSILLGIVLTFLGLEFAYVGYSFIKVAREIHNSEDEEFINKHKKNSKGQRNVNYINAFIAIIIILYIVSVVITIKFNEKNVSETELSSSQETTVLNTTHSTSQTSTQNNEADNETNNEDHSVVFATNTGERYHYSQSCAGDQCFAVTIEEALKHNLQPCKKCVKE